MPSEHECPYCHTKPARIAALERENANLRNQTVVLYGDGISKKMQEKIERLERENAALKAESDALVVSDPVQHIIDLRANNRRLLDEGGVLKDEVAALRQERDQFAAGIALVCRVRDDAKSNMDEEGQPHLGAWRGDKMGYLKWGYKDELLKALDSLTNPSAILAARLAAERKAGAVAALKHLLTEMDEAEELPHEWDIKRMIAQIERDEVAL